MISNEILNRLGEVTRRQAHLPKELARLALCLEPDGGGSGLRLTSQLLGAGRWLVQAKAELEHGEFGALFELLPFTERTGQRLMAVANAPRLNTTLGSHFLPASWRTLYELARLDEDQWAVVVTLH